MGSICLNVHENYGTAINMDYSSVVDKKYRHCSHDGRYLFYLREMSLYIYRIAVHRNCHLRLMARCVLPNWSIQNFKNAIRVEITWWIVAAGNGSAPGQHYLCRPGIETVLATHRVYSRPALWLSITLRIIETASWHLNKLDNIKAPRHWPLCGEIHRKPVNSPHKWGHHDDVIRL